MNVLQGQAAVVQLAELSRVSYQPLAEVFRAITPRETRHAELGREGLAQIVAIEADRDAARASVAYWLPRVAAGFGSVSSARFERLSRLGLRHQSNARLLADWQTAVDAVLADLSLT
jgi:1,2-phenylacetyl-CoA epoxidase catalytic subunit